MSIITKLLIATTGTGFFTLGASLVPAQAVLLDFSHGFASNCPECGQEFSFILDTSVSDINPSPTEGYYPNAISAIKIDGSLIEQSVTSVRTRSLSIITGPSIPPLSPGNYTQFSYSIVGNTINNPPFGSYNYMYNINLYFQGNELVNQLSPEPSTYSLRGSFSNATLGPGGALRGGIPREVYVTLHQDSNSRVVSEPATVAALGILGFGFLLKKKVSS
jgi:hypothetical protein